jgi:hypothetical protein
MFNIRAKNRTFLFLLTIFDFQFSIFNCPAGQPKWDPAKYMSVDEVRPGMAAYCLTCLKGTEIEKFNLDVLSVVRKVEPGMDWILVKCTDERFIHSGPIAGCSGSPVYIEGRLAGAIAYVPGGPFSKDPLFGVTPIEEMLKVGQGSPRPDRRSQQHAIGQGFAFDFSKPIDLAEITEQITAGRSSAGGSLTGLTTLPCPLIASGLPGPACKQLAASLERFGLMVVPAVGGAAAQEAADKDVQLAPGAPLAVPLVTGDITMEVLGTVTEVVDDKVYGFGHSFLGYGPVDLPMATAQVHTVVSSLALSFKLGSMLNVVGALTTDESKAILGRIGAKARMIPLTIRIERYNDTKVRVYNCQAVDNQILTPIALQSVVAGAVLCLGDLPPEHTIEYKVAIGIDGAQSVSFKNVSAGRGLAEIMTDSIGSVAMLMDNPYKKVDIKSIDFDVRVEPKNSVSHIWSVELSDSKVKAGQQVRVAVVVESFLAEKKKYEFILKVPEQARPGRYELMVCGSYGYEQFLRKAVPYRFIAQNMSGLIEALNDVLGIERDKLYCLLLLPPRGVALQGAELPDLPATKALILQDATRALNAQPYPRWLEKNLDTDTVIIDREAMSITVEK